MNRSTVAVGMFPLGDAICKIVRQMGGEERWRRQQAMDAWPEAVGGKLAAVSRPQGWQGSTLWVEVVDAVWAHQLSFLRHELIDRLNARLEKPVVKEIRFVIAGRNRRSESGRSPEPPADRATSAEPTVPEPFSEWFRKIPVPLATDLERAMLRWLRRQFQRRQPALEGLVPCPTCGAAATGPASCPACTMEWRPGGVRRQAYQLLREMPWLRFEEFRPHLPGVDDRIYSDVKGKLRNEWKNILDEVRTRYASAPGSLPRSVPRETVDIAVRYVCLSTGRAPDGLTPEDVWQALGPFGVSLFSEEG